MTITNTSRTGTSTRKVLARLAVGVTGTSTRKAPVTHKDLTMTYLVNGGGQKGVDAISPLLTGHTDPVAVLEKVIATLDANEQDTSELNDLRDVFAASTSTGVKGRKPVGIGESRAYSVQQINDGDLFIRLPLNALNVRKGQKVMVSFSMGKATVEV